MGKKLTLKTTPRRSLNLFLILGGTILAYIFFVILPYEKRIAAFDREISDLNARIENHKMLAPIFKDLLKSIQLQGEEDLSFPGINNLARGETDRLPSLFREMAQKSNLKLKGFRLDLKSIVTESERLEAELVVNGNFMNFRNFLQELSEIPYLENIERINLQTVLGSKELEFKLKVALARG